MNAIATDTQGNVFHKKVRIHRDYERPVVDFGWPVEYYANDLVKDYPYDRPMRIDIGGRNHRGFPVEISANEMNRVLRELGLVKE